PHHPLVSRSFERHDEVRQVPHRLPFPGDEFGVMSATAGRSNVDLFIVAGKSKRIPLLGLAAILATPGPANEVARAVLGEPIVDLPGTFDRAYVGFLVKFAQRCRPRVFVAIDAALRHLPDMGFVDVFRPVGTAADKDKPGVIEHHDTDARTIWQIFEAGHTAVGQLPGVSWIWHG